MGFVYEIKEGTEPYIELRGYEGRIEYLEIPERLSDLPVRVIAARAFWRRQDILSICLPPSVRELHAFAFYNCRNLRHLSLSDSVRDYHDGVLKLCEALREIEIDFREGDFRLLKELLGDHDGGIRCHLHFPDGQEAELYFPDFADDFEEDTYARALHERIEGSGYMYRQTVKRTELDFRQYDRIFERGKHEALAIAARIALSRLRYPYRLSEEAALPYRAYLMERNAALLSLLLAEGEEASIRFLAREGLLTEEGIAAALPFCAERRLAELTAVLLNYREAHFMRRSAPETFVL
ncbi:leucine-rich repeat protein [Oribacterium sp. oral taxon 102]|uniref:leucine-rich repeat protein n=1 Tax=Oribacterium sp. oral taxon 102 TaxID=671214 RepID=UPI0015BB7A61|nr:leucine-rich repeat protein [Oribacterium sp. oral taxon 102]NWO21211.1 leucine-rich repeat protein [Oribacterium sp. oral taxon 102]